MITIFLIEVLKYLFLFSLSLLLIYFLVPEILLHLLGIGSWKRQYSPGVTITFDDGPDPKYTPILLNILHRQDIKACFFLIGQKAEKYPELVQMIKDQGHYIGSHGYIHKHAWLLSPVKTWGYWDKSIRTIKDITGEEPDFIRAPWGGFNLSLLLWCLVRKKKIIGWNAKGKDWLAKRSSLEIIDTILKDTSEGTIILLHDGGGEQGAPANTLACLEELIYRIKQNLKLPIVPLELPKWSTPRRLFYRLWEKWEHVYSKINKIDRIDDHNLFRLALSKYNGPDLVNDQGQIVAKKGDIVGEIHLDNIRFQLIGADLDSIGIKALKQIRLSLPTLASYICINPAYKNVKAYLGVTMLNRGVKGLGFYVLDYPYNNGHFIGLFQKVLMQIYHPAGTKRKTRTLGDKPKIVWITKEKLVEKYISKEKIIS